MSSSLKLKTVFAGSGATGKTSIISVFMYDNFKQHTMMTVSPEKEFREIVSSNETKVLLEVWDTAGQERFRSVNKIYYIGKHSRKRVFFCSKRTTLCI